jgi:hypothetical protein
MKTALIVYFILTADHKWRFFAIEPIDSAAYCVDLAIELHRLFADKPGNMRVICMVDERVQI